MAFDIKGLIFIWRLEDTLKGFGRYNDCEVYKVLA